MDSHDAAGALKVERQESCGVIVPASSLAAKRNEPLQEPEPSLWSRVLNYFYPSVNPKPAKERPLRIVCVGVHGWAVFGGWWFSDPHSISHNIAERLGHAASSFMSGQDFGDVQLDLIALSGHGLVMQRFELYMNEQLPTHEQAFRDADVVLFGCHSQGSVVGYILLDELIKRQWLSPSTQRIGLLSLCGVHHGPFPDIPRDFLSATAELFALSQPFSNVASLSLSCLQRLLDVGVRIFVLGAFMDQVVPLYSATVHAVNSHPALLRTMYVSSDDFPSLSQFPARLLALCLRWSNEMQEQCDLLPHISGFFRRSILDRNGTHSSMHNDDTVYEAAASWFLQRRPKEAHPAPSSLMSHTSAHWANFLTESFYWSPLNAYFVRTRLDYLLSRAACHPIFQDELLALKSSFQTWTPKSKEMKRFHKLVNESFLDADPAGSEQITEGPDRKRARL